jgi:hypothetical protein
MNLKTLLIIILNIIIFESSGFSQSKKYKGLTLKAGRFGTTGLMPLNSTLKKLNLKQFEDNFFTFGFGYSWISKKGIYLNISQEIASQRTNTNIYNQNFLATCIAFNTGYEVYNKNNVTITPSLGIGLNSLALSIAEKFPNSSKDFNAALFLDKKSNSVAKLNGVVAFSLIGTYKVKVGDTIENVENGTIISERHLPIGIEVGYRFAKGIGNWMVFEPLNNSPETNLSGYYLTARIGGLYKNKKVRIH